MFFYKLLQWARITKASADDQTYAVQQMEHLGKVSDGLLVFPYGSHANVPADAFALMFAVQGNCENRAAIAWTPKIRPKLAPGEVAFYHPPSDGVVIWRTGGNLEVTTSANVDVTCADLTANASGQITINTPTMTLNGNLVVNGTMTNNGKDVGDTHQHAQGPDSNGDTEANIVGVL